MKKRNIISVVLLMAVAAFAIATFNSCKPHKFIGLQLYSIRDSIMRDVPAAIAKVGKMGYKFVEPAGYGNGKLYGMDPVAFKELCAKNGLVIISSHVGQPLPDSANMARVMAWWDTCIDAHVAAGAKYLIQPFMYEGAYRNLDTLKMYCNYFNAVGEKCKAKGLIFGYHNHSEEFKAEFDGKKVYDYMMENTDPSKVMFEMDLYWAVQGGVSPVDYFNKYPGRIQLWHIKDKAEVGASGKMDFASIFAAAATSGMKYGVVEVEEYNFDQFTSCQKSIDYLNNSDFVVLPEK
jgi:sugar phosphate isomerase/epimerase